MEIRRSRHFFNRRFVVFALFVLAAFGCVVATLIVAPQDAGLALQSAITMGSREAPSAGAAAATAPSTREATAPTRYVRQSRD